jgi:hypothetical protein
MFARSIKPGWTVLVTSATLLVIVAMGGISRRMMFAAEIAVRGSTNSEHSSRPITISTNPAAFEDDRAKGSKSHVDSIALAGCHDHVTHQPGDEPCGTFRAHLQAPTTLLSLQNCSVRLQV